MKRASTPTHVFTLPFDSSMISRFLLTYSQDGKIVLNKTEQDMTVNGSEWRVTLTQEETNLFHGGAASCQIRVLTPGGDVPPASQEMRFYVYDVHNDEVLS